MSENLATYVSGSIARKNPFGDTPDVQAWQSGSSVVPSTWGDYVSRLAEHLDDGSSPEQLLGRLGIGSEELSDPSIHFGVDDRYAFRQYKSNFMARARAEAEVYFMPEVDRLVSALDTVQQAYTVKDQERASRLADVLQEEIDSELDRVEPLSPESQDDAFSFKLADLGMKRDALRSGVVIPAVEFVNVMRQVNLTHDGPFKSELAHVWVKSMTASVDTFHSNYRYVGDIPAAQVTFGRDVFDEMRRGLKYIIPEIDKYAQERWTEILPAFAPDLRAIHALIDGKARSEPLLSL